MKELIYNGANRFIKNIEGKTPLDLLTNEYSQKEEDSQSQKS